MPRARPIADRGASLQSPDRRSRRPEPSTAARPAGAARGPIRAFSAPSRAAPGCRWPPSSRPRLGELPLVGRRHRALDHADRRRRRRRRAGDVPAPLDHRWRHGPVLPRHRAGGPTRARRWGSSTDHRLRSPSRRSRRVGGLVAPAALYLAVNPAARRARGLGRRDRHRHGVPARRARPRRRHQSTQLRVFLLTLTIIDDVVGGGGDRPGLYGEPRRTPLTPCGRVPPRAGGPRPSAGLAGGARTWARDSSLWLAMVGGLTSHDRRHGHGPRDSAATHPCREAVERAASLSWGLPPVPHGVGRPLGPAGLSARPSPPNERHPDGSCTRGSSYLRQAAVCPRQRGGGPARRRVRRRAFSSPVTWGVVAGLAVGKLGRHRRRPPRRRTAPA